MPGTTFVAAAFVGVTIAQMLRKCTAAAGAAWPLPLLSHIQVLLIWPPSPSLAAGERERRSTSKAAVVPVGGKQKARDKKRKKQNNSVCFLVDGATFAFFSRAKRQQQQ